MNNWAGTTKEAEDALRRSLAQDPSRQDLHLALGFNLQEQGRFSEADDSFRAALTLQPNQGNAYYGLAQGRKFKAEDQTLVEQMLLVLANGGLDNDERRHLCYALGKAGDDLGRYEQAIGYFDEANRLALAKMRATRPPFDRGRYQAQIDRTMSLFSPAFFARFGSVGSSSRMPLLVLGMMRSGTTLVEQILSSHPEIGTGGELLFWMQNARMTLDAQDAPQMQRLVQIIDGYLALLRSVAPGKSRVIDKTPANYLLLGAIHLAFPKAKIVHCRRNPVDTCLSIYMQSYSVSPDFAHDRGNIVFMYQQYKRLMEHWRRTISPEAMLEVDYEDLVADREAVTRQMIDFCGLGWSEECLKHERNAGLIRTSSVWQARQPIYKTSVERWRNYEPWLGDFRLLIQ